MFVVVAQFNAWQRRKLAMPAPPPLQESVVHGPFEHVQVVVCEPLAEFVKVWYASA
jgi:hypothetical protein